MPTVSPKESCGSQTRLCPRHIGVTVYPSAVTSLVIHSGVALLPSANEVWGKVMFLHLSVILFTRGVSAHCILGYTHPSTQADSPPGQTPPLSDTTDTVNKRAGMHTCLNFGSLNPRKVKKKFLHPTRRRLS